jgi:hypothetical protein
VIFLVGEIIAEHAAADRGALQALLLHRGFQHLRREIGSLHRQRREGRRSGPGFEPHSSASFSLLILQIASATSRSLRYQNGLIDRISMSIAIASISLQALLDDDEVLLHALHRRRTFLASSPIRSIAAGRSNARDVDGLDALALDHDRQPRGRLLRVRRDGSRSRRTTRPRASRAFQEIPACRHWVASLALLLTRA